MNMKSINRVTSRTAVTGIGSSFDLAKRIDIDMEMFPPSQHFEGYMSLIVLQLSNINTASEITMRLCRDQAGDQMLITDTVSDIFTGITTATNGSAIFALNSFVKVDRAGDLYAFVKLDTGSCDLDFVEITYQGDR
tara:strand:+ start:426 stop:833 length:408 start_codon:yes stop_codon:yes gene_type:complete